nr:allophanate hydrolase subunit 1 [Lysobacter enzymogenes]
MEFEALADDAWLLRLGERIDDALNARVHALAARVRAPAPPWLRDLVPAYASLAVFFDPAQTDAATVRDWLLQRCGESVDGGNIAAAGAARVVEIPVAYGGEFGPDLDEAASQLGLTAAQLVERHSGGDYRVAMIGFAPGFPYLSGLDPALALPRLASPRTQVAAGSVAIGGAQTGIYRARVRRLAPAQAHAAAPVRCATRGAEPAPARRPRAPARDRRRRIPRAERSRAGDARMSPARCASSVRARFGLAAAGGPASARP